MSEKTPIGRIHPIRQHPPTMLEQMHKVLPPIYVCTVCGMNGQDFYTQGRPKCKGDKPHA